MLNGGGRTGKFHCINFCLFKKVVVQGDFTVLTFGCSGRWLLNGGDRVMEMVVKGDFTVLTFACFGGTFFLL